MSDKAMQWTGRIISTLIVLFLILDAVGKLMKLKPYVEGTAKVGFAPTVLVPLGVVLLVSTLIYAVPRTSVLGAILLTGYLGGATATHVRMGEAFWFPVAFGVLAWLGLYLRDARLRSLTPFRGSGHSGAAARAASR